jgi:methyl-accepting chemotaxis protein
MASSLVTEVVVVLILVLSYMTFRKDSERNYKNEIVSLGVLGTFVGIAIGLYHFDASDIKTSMPYLLDGLKTAFITSGVGIFFSIIISIYKPSNKNEIFLKNIELNQLKIIDTLDKSLEHITKNANSELAMALDQIVKDFNSNLNDQFGQNFKELNHAVGDMVVWQENYKKILGNYEDSVKRLLTDMESMSKMKLEQEKNITSVTKHLSQTSTDVTRNLKESTEIVEESMQLLLREANGKL